MPHEEKPGQGGFVQRIIDDVRKRQARKPAPAAPPDAPLRKGYAVDPAQERRDLAAGPRREMTTTPQPFLDELYSSVNPIGYTGQKVGQKIGQKLPLPQEGKDISGAIIGAFLDPTTYVGGLGGVKGIASVAAGTGAAVLAQPHLRSLPPAGQALAQAGIGLAAGVGTYGVASGAQAVGKAAVAQPRSVPGRLLRAPAALMTGAVSGSPAQGGGTAATIKQRPASWFQLEPFEDPGDRLVGPPTRFEGVATRNRVLRTAYGAIDPAAVRYSEPAANLGIKKMVYEETQKARAHGAVAGWWADAKPAMGFDDKGVAKKVKLAPGAPESPIRGTIMDIVEHPQRYDLTPAQQAVVDDALALMDSVLASEKAAGVQVNELADYWARIVTDDPNKQQTLLQKLKAATEGPTMPGSKGHTKARTFDFAEDTVKAGFTINTDPVQTLTNRLDAGIQAISNREATMRVGQIPGVHLGEASFGEGQLQRWAAPRETLTEIQKWIDLPEFYKESGGGLGEQVLQAYRTVLTSFDLGSATLQTGRTLWRNPVAWTRSVAAGTRAMAREPLSYIAANQGLIDRGIKNGSITPPTEFLFPDRGLAAKVAGITFGTAKTTAGNIQSAATAPLRASNRFMQWNIFVAQTELYKAAEGMGGKGVAELVSLGRAIRHQTGSESYAVLGVRQKQRMVEGIALFAPRFVRAMVNEIGQAFTGGPGGHEARRSIGTALAGMTALNVAANYAQGRTPNYTDPTQESWGRFKLGDSWVSPYGPLHNYLRTAARVTHYIEKGDPGRAATEVGRFAQNKEGIVLGLLSIGAEVGFTGESADFEGNVINKDPRTWRHALGTPITPTKLYEGLAAHRAESLLNIGNVNINPESAHYTWRQYVEGKTGKPIDTLTFETRRYYQKQDEHGRALYKEAEKRYENERSDPSFVQDFTEELIKELITQGQPPSVMRDHLDFLRSNFTRPNRIKDEEVRALYRAFREAADTVEGAGFWDLKKLVPQYGKPDWAMAYELWRENQGISEDRMGLTPTQLARAKAIHEQVEVLEEKMLGKDPEIETLLVTYYGRAGTTIAGLRLKLQLDRQRAAANQREAARKMAESVKTGP